MCCRRSQSSIFRLIGCVLGIEPDVVSLGFPFQVCKKIFVQLSLTDLGNCMLVCKEWRSLIDTCHFWQSYILQHYDWALAEPFRWSVISHWKHRVYSLQVQSEVPRSVGQPPGVGRGAEQGFTKHGLEHMFLQKGVKGVFFTLT